MGGMKIIEYGYVSYTAKLQKKNAIRIFNKK
jgi:hypothetical protein